VQNSCFWEIVDPNAQPGFNDCANFAEEDACIGTEACVTVTGTPDSSVCAETCTAPADCPGAPATGTAVAACADIDGDAGAMECYLDCSADADSCPDNMVCVDDTQCMFQLQATEVFSEDFQGQSIPGTWTLHDEDGRTPAAQVAFIDAAWVASDFAQAGEFTAVSTSFYNPVGASDDWMVTPAIDLSGATNAKLRFLARSQDGNFRDSYEVHVNTTGPDVADFAAAAVLTVTDEFPTDFPRIVDLSAFDGNATVFIAIRNVSDDRYVLHVDDFRVTAD
jgi:hypothetical protein